MMIPYITYSSNTSSSITIDSLKMYISNYGVQPILDFQFTAYNGNGYGNSGGYAGDFTYDEDAIEIYQGETSYVNSPLWSTVTSNTTYTKSPSSAVFSFSAGQQMRGTMDIWANTDKTFTTYAQGSQISSISPVTYVAGTEVSISGFDITFSNEYSVGTLIPSESKEFMETRAPMFIGNDGTEYKLYLSSLENGIAFYDSNISQSEISDADFIAPVIYLEQDVSEIEIPVNGSMIGTPFSSIEVRSVGTGDDARLVIDYTVSSSDFVPYDMVLSSNGIDYTSSMSAYMFDSETGNFTRGTYVFNNLSAEDIDINAFLKTTSAMEKSVPAILQS